MQDIIYEVFVTDVDLLEGNLIHQGFSRDIAETIMCKQFVISGKKIDFMLVNHATRQPLALLLTDETIAKRGDCLT